METFKTKPIILLAITFVIGVLLMFFVLDGRIYFGHGLGDVFYLILLGVLVILQLLLSIWTVIKGKINYAKVIGISYLVIYSLFFYKMTLGRGPEYKWNGEVFINKKLATTTHKSHTQSSKYPNKIT